MNEWVTYVPTDVNHGELVPYFTQAFADAYQKVIKRASGPGDGATDGAPGH